MDSFGLRNLLCLILLRCIHQTSTLENVLEDFLGAADEEMGHQNQLKLIMEAKARLGTAKAGREEFKVAFEAQRHTQSHLINPMDPIIYDSVTVNRGDRYNNSSGKFSCNETGLYFFSYSAMPFRGIQTDVLLMKNGTEVAVIHSAPASGSAQLSIKDMVLDLTEGEDVWVKLDYGQLWSRNGSLSFLGFLLD